MNDPNAQRSRRAGWLLLGLAFALSVWGLTFAMGSRSLRVQWAQDVQLWQATAASVNARAAEGALFAPCEFRSQQTRLYLDLAQSLRGVAWSATAIAADVADGCVPPEALPTLRERVDAALAAAARRESAVLPWPAAQLMGRELELERARVAVERALLETRMQQCYAQVSHALRAMDAPGPQSGLGFYASCSRSS
ncbi:hypothetical protein [Dolichospermum phage Dfl-JY45]